MPITRSKTIVPSALEPLAIGLWFRLRPLVRLVLSGQAHYCPVCGSRCWRFLAHGPPTKQRQNAVCPVCLSHERHRLAWLFLSPAGLLDRRPRTRLLHVAPDTEFQRLFRSMDNIHYLSADLNSPHAGEKVDITNAPYPDASFDAIICIHTLEHIPDDRAAMRELLRLLAPGGWALIQVPLSTGPTFEDPSVTNPAERERLFWQHDHVRLYGLDIADRLEEAGFEVKVIPVAEIVPASEQERLGIDPLDAVFLCMKPSESPAGNTTPIASS